MIDYSKIVPQRVATLKPSGIRKFFDVAATMEDVISLGVASRACSRARPNIPPITA